jgi:hypothetical protein
MRTDVYFRTNGETFGFVKALLKQGFSLKHIVRNTDCSRVSVPTPGNDPRIKSALEGIRPTAVTTINL